MTEQTHPEQPPQEPPPDLSEMTSTGLDPRLAGLLCYILWPITGLIFLLIEKTNAVVRFHAAQSLVSGVALILLFLVLTVLQIAFTVINWTLGSLVGIVWVLVWIGAVALYIVLLIKGYSGEKWKLPTLGDMAERLATNGL